METSRVLLGLACFFDLNKVYLPTYLPTYLDVDVTYSILLRKRHLLEGKYLVAISPAGFNESF